MALSLKEKLAAKKAGTAKPASNLRDKFKPRKAEVLEETFSNKDKRTKSSGAGRSIFNEELMAELGLTSFKINTQKEGAYFTEIMPCSFDAAIPYFVELAVHDYVGVGGDSYICMNRYNGSSCFRCKKQKELYGIYKTATDEIKQLYPRDKVIYLVWDRTAELSADAGPTYQLALWVAPKIGVHAEIQSKVRDKLSKAILDISSIEEDGEGRTVYFEISMKEDKKNNKTFPSYGGFDLVQRDKPIPDEIVEKLYEVVTKLEEKMTPEMTNPLQALLRFPEEGELEEAMGSEVHAGDETNGKENPPAKPMTALEKIRAKKAAAKEKKGITLEELENILMGFTEVEQIVDWAEKHNSVHVLNDEMAIEDMQNAIYEYFESKANADKPDDDIPF